MGVHRGKNDKVDARRIADYAAKKKRLSKLLADLATNISAIDKKIDALIDGDDTLAKQHKLLCSISGNSGSDEEKRW